jgi:sulfide:quinone oxidoreductase
MKPTKTVVILGAGTAGTIMANQLCQVQDEHVDLIVIVIEQSAIHHYQPGYLFIPFGIYTPEEIQKPVEDFIPQEAILMAEAIERIDPDANAVLLSSGKQVFYDVLIIATGNHIAPEETEGMMGPLWHKDIFDFYTLEGAIALRDKLQSWNGVKLVVHITEMPIKCPVAPLEFTFLSDAYFREKGMRDKVDITFVTPMSGAFTKPRATQMLDHLLEEKSVNVVPDFCIELVDNERKLLVDYGGKEVPFDLLVTTPLNMGADFIGKSGLGDDLNYVPTHKATLQSKQQENIFVLGDATDIPASKAGSVAHFESEILTRNILQFLKGMPLESRFDGHANCFVETGGGKAILLDFNYTHEPVEGEFPLPGVGPLRLLQESRMNHWGKLAFKWIYWNLLLKGRHIPFVEADMQEAGKHFQPK